MRLLKKLERNKEFIFLILTSFLFFLLRFPSLFEPLWYGDEGVYQVIGTSLNHGKLLYKEIFDNKPPLLYWLYSFFHSDQFTVRLASLMFGLLSVVVFFFLSKKLFKNKKNIYFFTTFVFAILFGLPMIEGNIANAENFMLLPITLAAFLIFNPSSLIINPYPLSGLLLGLAFLFKVVAIFDFAAFIVFLFILNFNSPKKVEIQKVLYKLFPIAIGFFLPLTLVTLFFILNGTFLDFVNAALTTNIPYVSYGNKIGSFPTLLFVKLFLLGIFIFYIFKKRKEASSAFIFILIWFAFSLFNALFSQRPYAHYLLVLLPSFCFLIGLILFDKKNRGILIFFLIASFVVATTVFGIPKTIGNIYYYQNFISYVKGEKSTSAYQAFFDLNTPFDYEIARFIKPKLHKNETIFIWGNNAQLYELVGVVAPTKYIVAYHIVNYKGADTATKNALEKIKPKFIVVMPKQSVVPFSLSSYYNKININNALIYGRLF